MQILFKNIFNRISLQNFSALAGQSISLILGPDMHRDLRGEFCLRQNSKPLKCSVLTDLFTLSPDLI